jgi:hypothetical protein
LYPSRGLDDRMNLARMLAIGAGRHVGWSDGELTEMLEHQLQSPLLEVLQPPADVIHSFGADAVNIGANGLITFNDLLTHQDPPIALLRLANEFANSADMRQEDPLPANVATTLYFLTIAAALARHRKNISPMEDSALRRGLKWVQDQSWVGQTMRDLTTAALAVIPSETGPSLD